MKNITLQVLVRKFMLIGIVIRLEIHKKSVNSCDFSSLNAAYVVYCICNMMWNEC